MAFGQKRPQSSAQKVEDVSASGGPSNATQFLRQIASLPLQLQAEMLRPSLPLCPPVTPAPAVQRQEGHAGDGGALDRSGNREPDEQGLGTPIAPGEAAEIIEQVEAELEQAERANVMSFFRHDQNTPGVHWAQRRLAGEEPQLTGLGATARIEPFIDAMRALQTDWEGLDLYARVERIHAAVNRNLSELGVPEVGGIVPVDSNSAAATNPMEWIITVREHDVARAQLGDQEAIDLATNIYHEARHVEQLFRALRWLAGQNLTQEEILGRSEVRFPSRILEAAMADPLVTSAADEAEGRECENWEESLISDFSGSMAVTAVVSQRIQAVDEQRLVCADNLALFRIEPTTETLTALQQELRELRSRIDSIEEPYVLYRELAHESDAHEIGSMVEAVFLRAQENE